MVRRRTSSICLNAKETRVSDHLIIQTTANSLQKCKRQSKSSFRNERDQRRHFSIGNVKFAVAKETEKFAKAKRMFSDNLEA